MKLIIAGGRRYRFTDGDIKWLDALLADHGVTEVVSGGAPGADTWGERWAFARDLPVRQFPADWHALGLAAGPRRNEQMAKYADAAALFPGGNGTADMQRRAERHGLKVFVRYA